MLKVSKAGSSQAKAERGATSAHVVARLPSAGAYDDGSYRCVVEYAPPITRAMIERFLSRQLRRVAHAEDWSFSILVPGKKGTQKEKKYKYHPKVQLLSDFGRKLNANKGKTLTHVVFTKRQEKQSAGKETDVEHQDFVADVEFRVSAKQAPEDPEEKQGFFRLNSSPLRNAGLRDAVLFSPRQWWYGLRGTK